MVLLGLHFVSARVILATKKECFFTKININQSDVSLLVSTADFQLCDNYRGRGKTIGTWTTDEGSLLPASSRLVREGQA